MKIISKVTWEEHQRLYFRNQRLVQAHRWLSEFDEFLEPFWKHLLTDHERNWDISEVREQMRARWKELKK